MNDQRKYIRQAITIAESIFESENNRVGKVESIIDMLQQADQHAKIAEKRSIVVSVEMHKFLKQLSKELNSQNHRGTRMPYFLQVQTKKEIAVPEGNGIKAWFYDGCKIESEDEIKAVINEYKGWEGDDRFNELRSDEIEEMMEEMDYSKIYYDFDNDYENCFLTAKACDEYMRLNKHNLTDPQSYLFHAFRNPEMEKLFEFILGITNNKLHK